MKRRCLFVMFSVALLSFFAIRSQPGDAAQAPGGLPTATHQSLAEQLNEILEKLDVVESCIGRRFVDRAKTVFDCEKRLEWEKKTEDGNIHDVEDLYTWSNCNPQDEDPECPPNGTVFTEFLAALNTEPCFDEHCDWQLPDFPQLRSILLVPCGTTPCIDPVLGPTAENYYWTSEGSLDTDVFAGAIHFGGFGESILLKNTEVHVRAVRTVP